MLAKRRETSCILSALGLFLLDVFLMDVLLMDVLLMDSTALIKPAPGKYTAKRVFERQKSASNYTIGHVPVWYTARKDAAPANVSRSSLAQEMAKHKFEKTSEQLTQPKEKQHVHITSNDKVRKYMDDAKQEGPTRKGGGQAFMTPLYQKTTKPH
ncbi:hypothetical protein GGR57DRAFT_500177 [Xylariaceae sp. FL1272]|nr:hypothetical protein GGR57DRAFT_500177 [Xylariaceae sp. FL1272]